MCDNTAEIHRAHIVYAKYCVPSVHMAASLLVPKGVHLHDIVISVRLEFPHVQQIDLYKTIP